jgi:hypothetical protein
LFLRVRGHGHHHSVHHHVPWNLSKLRTLVVTCECAQPIKFFFHVLDMKLTTSIMVLGSTRKNFKACLA